MVYFRKRLTPEILGEINEMILQQEQAHDDSGSSGGPAGGNSGTMIVDATCAPSQIKYPQDTALLNEARENTEAIIDELHILGEAKPRTYRKRAHKEYLALVRCRKPSAKKIRKCIGKQLNYLRRNLKTIEEMLINGQTLPPRMRDRLENNPKSLCTAENHVRQP